MATHSFEMRSHHYQPSINYYLKMTLFNSIKITSMRGFMLVIILLLAARFLGSEFYKAFMIKAVY